MGLKIGQWEKVATTGKMAFPQKSTKSYFFYLHSTVENCITLEKVTPKYMGF
jgi:hypothetical protein